jgi:phage host-nuclease inhibitor protein Gam
MEETLAALGSRVFLMNNVHDDAPTIFHSRWAMSFLRGPLSRLQIQELMDERKQAKLPEPVSKPEKLSTKEQRKTDTRPIVPNDVEERFWIPSERPQGEGRLTYRPGLLVQASCHYVRVSADVDDWIDRSLLYLPKGRLPTKLWSSSVEIDQDNLDLAFDPEDGYGYADIPASMLDDKQMRRWEKDARDHLYRHVPITVYECEELDVFSRPGQDELDARIAWKQLAREVRDREKEKLRAKYAAKLKSLEDKIRSTQQRLEREKAQYDKEKWNTVLNFGQTVLSAILGNKVSSRGATTGRSLGRAAQQRTDVTHANEKLEDLMAERFDLQSESETALAELQSQFGVENLTLEPLEIPCRKGDLKVHYIGIVWVPFHLDASGFATPLVQLRASGNQ